MPGLGTAEEDGAALGEADGGVLSGGVGAGVVCGGATGDEDAADGGAGTFGRGKAPGA